ncbi:sugar porter (SP) family MFS transporter (macronuclear) [Tetrahymena thermophila SB210]|uniref:Hexose transporter 1 n=1 Tax=Tetrahymena thermophila (strain SB210) TaxID=312017 RepID=Q22Y64_TETTS|nr:sugar porter (SP) family MFS transporter [Tetrahymena thermophila SB210]EAR90160.1 sugar porter (SP) family MFS transporter [Tetrahymena thermophila SB210]|eukprot:XP_001010405.1 sugar porter (SP) family MFS transporter [Tetrahymena thermophila SB210]
MKKREHQVFDSNKQKEELTISRQQEEESKSDSSSPSSSQNNLFKQIDSQSQKMKDQLTEKEQNYKSFAKVLAMVLVASIGSLYFGYSLGVMSLAQDTIFAVFDVDSDKKDMYSSLINASIPLGAMIGSISAGLLLNYVSRKNAFIITDIIGVIACCLTQITNINLFLFLRLISGIVTGLNSALVPQYIQEVSPIAISGIMGTIFSMCINTGIIIASLNGQFFQENPTSSDTYWRYVLLFPLALTVTRTLFLFLFFNYETPFYYILKNEPEKCKQFLEKIYKPQFVDEVQSEVEQQVEKVKQSSEGYLDMFKPQYRKRLIIGCTLQLFQQFSGINAVIMYSSNIFKDNNYDFRTTNLLSLISNIVLLSAAFLSGFFVSRFGRRAILIYGSALSGAFQLGLAILSKVNNKDLSMLSVAFIFLYFVAFNFSLGPIVWLYCSEILPEKGIGIATMSNWIGATIIVLVLPYFSALWPLFIFYAAMCFACVAFTIFLVKETKDKSKIEITNMYLPKGSEQYNNLSTYSTDKEKYNS